MREESIIYCFMNKKFEFIDESGNITDDIKEAAGYREFEDALEARNELDEPDVWKIVKKKITYTLEEIYE